MERPRTSISTAKSSPWRCASTGRDRTSGTAIPGLRRGQRPPPLPGARAQDRLGDVKGLPQLGDVVHAEHLSPPEQRQHIGGDRAAEPLVDLPARELAQEALTGGADHDRPAEPAQPAESPPQPEV